MRADSRQQILRAGLIHGRHGVDEVCYHAAYRAAPARMAQANGMVHRIQQVYRRTIRMRSHKRHTTPVRNHAVKPRIVFRIEMKQPPTTVRFIRRQHIGAVLGVGDDGVLRVYPSAVKRLKKIIHDFIRRTHAGDG